MKPEEHWLLALADPEGPRGRLPECRLDVPSVVTLCLLGNAHGVLPAVMREIERLLRNEPARLLADMKSLAEALRAIEPARQRLQQRSVMAIFLETESRRLMVELTRTGVEAIVLKGADFAARLYPQRGLRTFGDMDLLIHQSGWERVEAAMARLGYESRKQPMKHADGYSERSWENPAMPGAVVEVHDNLVNSPTVRRGVSVRLEDLPLERGPDEGLRATSAGLLVIAAVHGAASHAFEKVQHLCDVAQAARGRGGPLAEEALRECAAKTGAGFSLATGLDLAARSLSDPACAELLARLELRWPRRIVRLLMTPTVVVRSQGARRRSVSWRRQMLRQMLKSRR